jgi:hypothetical protein
MTDETPDTSHTNYPSPPARYTLRLIEVKGMLFLVRRNIRARSGSLEELQEFASEVKRNNLLLGWWGVVALVWNVMALRRNGAALKKLRGLAESGNAAEGWYPDPVGKHGARWWDGTTWTDRVRDEASDPPAPVAE